MPPPLRSRRSGHPRWFAPLLPLLASLLLAGCNMSPTHGPQITRSMLPPDDPGDESAIPFVSPFYNADQNPQSPKPPNPQWRGVLIAAPGQAVLTLRQPLLLLHGYYRIPGSDYPANDSIKLIAVDLGSKREFSAVAGQRDASPDVPPPPSAPPDPQTVKLMVFSGYFNTDLAGLLKLPRAAATYRVRAEFGAIPSNEITIQVTVQ